MNDTPFPPPAPDSEPDPSVDPTPVSTPTDAVPSAARRTRLAVGAVGLGGLLAVSGWLALAGDGHADDTDARRAGVADVSDTTSDEQLDATSQIDVDVDDDAAAGADGAPGSDGAAMPIERGGHHGGGRGQMGHQGQQGMGATAATPGAAPMSGSGGS